MSRGSTTYKGLRGRNNTHHQPRGGHYQRGRGGGRSIVYRPYQKPTLSDDLSWKAYPELKIKITTTNGGLPLDIDVRDIYECLKNYGTIVKVEIINKVDLARPRAAIVMFNPPPREPFWEHPLGSINGTLSGLLKAEMLDPNHQAQSGDGASRNKYEDVGSYPVNRLDFGFMYEENHFVLMRSLFAQVPRDVMLSVNKERREMAIQFSVDEEFLHSCKRGTFSTPRNLSSQHFEDFANPERHQYKFLISFKQLRQIGLRNVNDDFMELIISLPTTTPPLFFKKMDPATTMPSGETYWTQNRAWFRRTNVYSDRHGRRLRYMPVRLNEPEPFVNIGAWTTYRLCLPRAVYFSPQALHIREVFNAYNIDLVPADTLVVNHVRDVTQANPAVFWDALDHGLGSEADNTSILMKMSGLIHLEWSVRYQLEVCIAKDLLNPANLTSTFINKLSVLSPKIAVKLLEHIADKNVRFFEPMQIFGVVVPPKSKKKVPSNHLLQRSVTIKPSSMEPNTPVVEESNRVIREYPNHEEHFLRVVFRDEKSEGKIFSSDDEINDALFNRVRRCLNQGILVGGKHFEWLASGNSQFREHGAYFFNSTGLLSAHTIRAAMGNFSIDNEVAKAASRMGQCFSTTRDYQGSIEIGDIDDVTVIDEKGNPYVFTDGVGMISSLLVDLLNRQMKFHSHPTAYQFRSGGSKGVLALSKDVKGIQIKTRPSQRKFSAPREKLEIIRPAGFVRAELNRQLITILSSLQVEDTVFINKVQNQLSEIDEAIDQATHSPRRAEKLLRYRVDVNFITVVIADMLDSGFTPDRDPFVATLLCLWRAWSHKKLKEKASIQIDDGAFVMGVTDETQSLSGHFNLRQPNRQASKERWLPSLPEIFLQISDPVHRSTCRIIEGVCILARNPSLHPGDIRVVRAVDKIQLHHLKNVVVFPQTGDRDIPSMCSGGDLDGDDYFISWDEALIPPVHEWNHEPMKHTKNPAQKVNGVTDDQVKDFFVKHMKQDALGKIANGWLAQADQLEYGPKSETCKKLADLHSTAVDFPKTGNPASGQVFRQLRPRKYPHFLESNRPAHQISHSHSIIGNLFDMVQRVEFHPILNTSFDHRILKHYEPDRRRDNDVAALKAGYDASLRRIMAQFDIETESEIWSAFILKHGKAIKEYEIQSKVGNLINSVKEKFRESCIEKAGGRDFENLSKFVTAMYKMTAEQATSTINHLKQMYGYEGSTLPELQPHEMPMLSFPWIFAYELGKIANNIALPRAEVEIAPKNRISQKFPFPDDSTTIDPDDIVDRYADDHDNALSVPNGEGIYRSPSDQLLPVASFLDDKNSQNAYETNPKVEQPTVPQLSKNQTLLLDLDHSLSTPNGACHINAPDILGNLLPPETPISLNDTRFPLKNGASESLKQFAFSPSENNASAARSGSAADAGLGVRTPSSTLASKAPVAYSGGTSNFRKVANEGLQSALDGDENDDGAEEEVEEEGNGKPPSASQRLADTVSGRE